MILVDPPAHGDPSDWPLGVLPFGFWPFAIAQPRRHGHASFRWHKKRPMATATDLAAASDSHDSLVARSIIWWHIHDSASFCRLCARRSTCSSLLASVCLLSKIGRTIASDNPSWLRENVTYAVRTPAATCSTGPGMGSCGGQGIKKSHHTRFVVSCTSLDAVVLLHIADR